MNTLYSTIKIYLKAIGCMGMGMMLAGSLISFTKVVDYEYHEHPIRRWVLIFLSVLPLFFLLRAMLQIVRDRRDPAQAAPQAGVRINPMGVVYQTTPFVRTAIYLGTYAFGMFLGSWL